LRIFRNGIRAGADAFAARHGDDAWVMPGKEQLHVLIAGGGVAALEAMIALRSLAEERVDVELLAPDNDFFYRPLSVAEPFDMGEAHRFDLFSLARGCGARHTLGSVVAVDADEHSIRTSRNAKIPYDVLLIATGARPREAIRGALTFRGQTDVGAVRGLLRDLDDGVVQRVVFALPGGVTWPLPLYELALQTADHLSRKGNRRASLDFVTPEETPLAVLGTEASETVARLLEEREIALLTATYPETFENGELRVVPGVALSADRVVSLPRLRGVPLAGVPQEPDFFIPTNADGQVDGLADVYAAGDITTFPVKQGGLAAQQADAVAGTIAARAGSPVAPEPFAPVLRGLLLTGSVPVYLREELGGGHGETSTVGGEALWWPPSKIAARYLSPYLAQHAGLVIDPAAPAESLL
jgi:sulfide:quinone oxidoreductase